MFKSSSFAKGISEKLGKIFVSLPVSPDSITILSVILAILGYLSWGISPVSKIQAFILFLFAFFFDAVDGAIARSKNIVSKKGAFLDGISDRLVEFLLILSLLKSVTLSWSELSLIVILFFGTAMTAFVKAYAEHSQLLNHTDALKMPGLLERTERSVLLLVLMLLLLSGFVDVFHVVLYFTAIMSVLTFLQRFFIAYSSNKS